MNRFIPFLFALIIISCNSETQNQTETQTQTPPAYAMVIHGGAGTILKENMTEEKEAAYMNTLDSALVIGEEILKNGGTSLKAVEATIRYMEDSPLFNAGRGAVFTNSGMNEHDASVMQGSDQNAGAIGGTSIIKHPISAAIAVMEKSEHVMLVGKGAEEFSQKNGIETVDPSYFHTDWRWESLQKAKGEKEEVGMNEEPNDNWKYGTVGCVALDNEGNIVAGTSTGGMTNKKFNRVGDSPIIGAGTYADNATCGVSCTGHGEYFIRYAVAHDVASRMAYLNESVNEAAEHVVMNKLVEKNGSGGLIALDKYGNVAMPFNTPGMYRGYVKPDEKQVFIYK